MQKFPQDDALVTVSLY